MKSPFPGMDPYLEPHWLDIHARLVSYAADALNEVLPQTLVARIEERVAVESEWETRGIIPDVRVFSPASADPAGAEDIGGVAAAPFKLVVDLDPITERYIRILDISGHLITVIEFLSPTNKMGAGLEAYRDKRSELMAAEVKLVEVDLVRRGYWKALLQPHLCPRDALAAYRITIRLPPGRSAYLYPAPLRARLPDVPVPLRPEDPSVVLPLQRLIDEAYAKGRYALTLDYNGPCDPPLESEDAAWAEDLLRRAGKRG